MSNKKSHKSNINVPCDILFYILARLPVKSLLRFRSVSTSWNNIISEREFKKAQSVQSEVLGRVNFLLQKHHSDKFKFINSENQHVIVIEEQRFPLEGFERAHVLCSHNGLVLLRKREAYKTFVLWNPSTRQCQELASCPYLNAKALPRACGLCYDSTTDDYKVILIYKSFYLVYSTRNFWTKKKTLPTLELHLYSSLQATNNSCCPGITIEGCVYWSMDMRLHPYVKRNSIIIYFDVKSDKLKELSAPNFVGDKELFRLTTLKGGLCLYGNKFNGYLWSNESELDMWIMKEDGWKLLMKFPKVSSEFYKYSVLCCTKNGEIIFQEPKSSHISIYNPKQQKIVISDFISDYNIGYEYADPYPTGFDTLHFPFPKIMLVL